MQKMKYSEIGVVGNGWTKKYDHYGYVVTGSKGNSIFLLLLENVTIQERKY